MNAYEREAMDAVRKAEQHLRIMRQHRETLEAALKRLSDLEREYKHGHDYAQAIRQDLGDQRKRLEQQAEQWRKDHPLRTAASGVLGEPDFLRENRERHERTQREEREARERRELLKRDALENAAKQPAVAKQVELARNEEQAAWRQVESLLRNHESGRTAERPSPMPMHREPREQVAAQAR